MRRVLALAVALVAGSSGCTDGGRSPTGPERSRPETGRPSGDRVPEPSFSSGATIVSIAGLSAPGDGYNSWTAAGTLTDQASGRRSAVTFSSPDGRQWRRIPLDASTAAPSVGQAVDRRQGLVVVAGAVQAAGGDQDAAVWTSRDGQGWTASTVEAGSPGDQEITAVAAGPLGFVAGGLDRQNPALWFSPDGATWSRVGGGADSPFGEKHVVKAVAVGRPGAVAVGSQGGAPDYDVAVWFSSDGARWRQVSLDPAGFGGPGSQEAATVTATAGGFVAGGSVRSASTGLLSPAVWTSADGATWQPAPASPDLSQLPDRPNTADVPITAMAGSGPLFATGGSRTANQLWSSADGRHWARQDIPEALARAFALAGPVATNGRDVLVATVDTTHPDLWLRPAGGAWTRVSNDPAAFPPAPHALAVYNVARRPGGYVAFGIDSDPSDPGPGQHGERGSTAVWLSVDGRSWQRQADAVDVFRFARVFDVVVVNNGLVAVGFVTDDRDEDRRVGAVWTSSDGSAWQRVDRAVPSFTAQRQTYLHGVAPGGPGLVAVGAASDRGSELDAKAWVSPDGRSWQPAREPPEWGGTGDQSLAAVCALPGGGVVAVGATSAASEKDGWAWVSRDGLAWERASGDGAAALGGPGPQDPRSCATTATGVIAAGAVDQGNRTLPALWASPDGRSWRRLPDPTAPGAGISYLFSVASDGTRLAAVGHDNGNVLAYTSSDGGASWAEVESRAFGSFGFQAAHDVVVAGDQMLIVGQDEFSGALWVGRLPS